MYFYGLLPNPRPRQRTLELVLCEAIFGNIFWQRLSWPQLGIKSVRETLKLFEIPHEDRKFMIKKDQDYANKSPIANRIMECQGVAVESRAWIAAAECHLEGIIWEERSVCP